MEKASPLAENWLFERFNDSPGSFAVADVGALMLRLVSCEQEMEQFQRYEREVLTDLFDPVGRGFPVDLGQQ
jgi:hypothetical protein